MSRRGQRSGLSAMRSAAPLLPGLIEDLAPALARVELARNISVDRRRAMIVQEALRLAQSRVTVIMVRQVTRSK
jgi:hypothetical protein